MVGCTRTITLSNLPTILYSEKTKLFLVVKLCGSIMDAYKGGQYEVLDKT
jgi:hypothetical protein